MANRHHSVDSNGLDKRNLQAVQISGAPHQNRCIFTSAGIQKRWAPRISVPVEKQDNSPHKFAQDVLI